MSSKEFHPRPPQPEGIELPAPTSSPFTCAFGLTLVAAGLVTQWIVTIIGFMLMIVGAIGWFKEVHPDDREEIVRERLSIYKEETLPILDFYKSRDDTVIVDFETKRGKADYPQVKSLLIEAFGDDLLRVSSDEEELTVGSTASIESKAADAQ